MVPLDVLGADDCYRVNGSAHHKYLFEGDDIAFESFEYLTYKSHTRLMGFMNFGMFLTCSLAIF